MAQQGPPRTGLTHKASITDLVKDLQLLRVDTKDYGETMDSMVRALELRIEELKTNNGTLLEVCFSYDHFFHYIFYRSLQIICISYVHKTSTLSNSNKSRLVDNSGSWSVVSLILKFVNDRDRG